MSISGELRKTIKKVAAKHKEKHNHKTQKEHDSCPSCKGKTFKRDENEDDIGEDEK